MRTRSLLIAIVVALVAVACGDDDGADVRESGTGTGTGGGTSTGTGTATGTGTGTPTGSATGVAGECEPVGDLATAQTRVDVTLDEWTIEPETTTASAGAIGFVARNEGEEPHELVVVRGVTPNDLPLDDEGALDEDELPAGALVGEIEAFPAGTSCNGVFDLTPGEYTLVCNVVEEEEGGEHEAHLAEGMVTTFTVT
jgi:hypothetical protein